MKTDFTDNTLDTHTHTQTRTNVTHMRTYISYTMTFPPYLFDNFLDSELGCLNFIYIIMAVLYKDFQIEYIQYNTPRKKLIIS